MSVCPSLRVVQATSGSVKWQGTGLTRDLAESRVVLSCIQSLASSTPITKVNKSSTSSQKNSTRFDEFVEVSGHASSQFRKTKEIFQKFSTKYHLNLLGFTLN